MRIPAAFLLLLLAVPITSAQSRTRDWKPASVAAIDYSEEEKVIPRSHMVKRQGCVGGVGCYDRVQDEPTHVPLKIATYHFETADVVYVARMVVRYGNGRERPLNVTLHGKTQVDIEGMKIHILEDDGKEAKLDIVEKVAKAAK